jgi:hypothetical protein
VTVGGSNHSHTTHSLIHTSISTHQQYTALHSCFAGVKCLLEEDAVTVGGSSHSHATQDFVHTSTILLCILRRHLVLQV